MNARSESWGRFLARGTVLSLMVMAAAFVGNRLANAGPGEPVRKALTVSGVLTGAPASAMATFRFYRAMGDSAPLCSPEVPIRDGLERDAATGAFSVEVPLDQSGTGRTCPDTLFHDPSAYVEVAVGTTVVVTRRPVNPVPYAVYAQQYGTPDCPVGYSLEPTALPAGATICVRRLARDAVRGDVDYVVRVGRGATAFWIDLFEASVVAQTPASPFDGSGETLFDRDGHDGGLPLSGQWWTRTPRPGQPPAYALSRAGALPARWITWFQAQEACRASGKRLPTGEEWLTAVQGTPDPASGNDGNASDNHGCNTQSPTGVRVRPTQGSDCQSVWGAQDMIGNVWEWTAEWYAGAGSGLSIDFSGVQLTDGGVRPALSSGLVLYGITNWPDSNGDATWNVNGYVNRSNGTNIPGLPAAAVRGGSWADGTRAGILAFDLEDAPSARSQSGGFRCVIPR